MYMYLYTYMCYIYTYKSYCEGKKKWNHQTTIIPDDSICETLVINYMRNWYIGYFEHVYIYIYYGIIWHGKLNECIYKVFNFFFLFFRTEYIFYWSIHAFVYMNVLYYQLDNCAIAELYPAIILLLQTFNWKILLNVLRAENYKKKIYCLKIMTYFFFKSISTHSLK